MQRHGNEITFSALPGEDITVLPNGDYNGKALHLFIREPLGDIPDGDDVNVIYYGPGYYDLSSQGPIQVSSGQTVYIAGGAVVRGRFLVSNASQVTLCGPGILINDYVANDGYTITWEQLFYTLNISLKYFVALPVAILFISATDPSEFAASLNSIGVSYRVGYSVAIALRYIPDIQRGYHSISQARGVELGSKEKLSARLKNSVNILLPLILSSLARIDTISNAMELRGFGKKKKRTWYVQRPFTRNDWLVLALGVALLLASLVITFWDGDRFFNPFI